MYRSIALLAFIPLLLLLPACEATEVHASPIVEAPLPKANVVVNFDEIEAVFIPAG